jgi:hypothetical protein
LKFRQTAQEVWADWATRSDMCKKMVDSHVGFMTALGLLA